MDRRRPLGDDEGDPPQGQSGSSQDIPTSYQRLRRDADKINIFFHWLLDTMLEKAVYSETGGSEARVLE